MTNMSCLSMNSCLFSQCVCVLQDILKYTEKAEEDPTELKKALRVMRVVPKAANDMMQVGRLQGFDVS